jgi:hypothetical protein
VWCASGLVVQLLDPQECSAQRAFRLKQDITIEAIAHDLSNVGAVTFSSGGILAVSQPQDFRILLFDQWGQAVGSFGRRGEGPGEFRTTNAFLSWHADTLWIMENGVHRVTHMGPDFKLLRTSPLPVNVHAPSDADAMPFLAGSAFVGGILADGTLVMTAFIPPGVTVPQWLPIRRQNSALFLHTTSDGRLIRELGTLEGEAESARCSRMVGRTGGSISIPLCATPKWAIAASGEAVVFVTVPQNTNGRAVMRIIAIGSSRGDTLFNRLYTYSPRPISKRVVDSIRSRQMVRAGSSVPLREAWSALVFPAQYPPVERVFVGSDGLIWLMEPDVSLPVRRWTAVNMKGELIGTTELPANVVIRESRLGVAWGTIEDADGLQSLVKFTIVK